MKKIILALVVIILLITAVYVIQNKGIKQTEDESNNQNNYELGSNKLPDLYKNTDVSNSKTVNLSNKNLRNIPSYVFDKTNTEELNVSNNYLTGSIQGEIRFLSKLKILNASNNSMTGVPAEIGQLQNLEILDLSNNKLTGLPNELGNLQNLKVLNLSGNKYSEQDLAGIRSNLPSTVNIILN